MINNSRYRRILKHARSFTITVGNVTVLYGFNFAIGAIDNDDHYGDTLTRLNVDAITKVLSVDFSNDLNSVQGGQPSTLFLKIQGHPVKMELTRGATLWEVTDTGAADVIIAALGKALNCSLSY